MNIKLVEGNHIKKATETSPKHPAKNRKPNPAADLVDLLQKNHSVFAEFKPLAVGILSELFEQYPELSRRTIRRAMAWHTRDVRYTAVLMAEGERYHLDGTPAQSTIEPEHSAHAKEMTTASMGRIKVIQRNRKRQAAKRKAIQAARAKKKAKAKAKEDSATVTTPTPTATPENAPQAATAPAPAPTVTVKKRRRTGSFGEAIKTLDRMDQRREMLHGRR